MHLEPLRNVPSSSRQDDGVPTAIVGCARSEVHELGALMTRRILEFNGYNVQYLGLDVPTWQASGKTCDLRDQIC